MPDRGSPKIRTLEWMLLRAQNVVRADTDSSDACDLAMAFLEMFGEAQPCGQISPEVYPGEVIITREMVGRYEPREALAQAIGLINAATEAQEQKV